MAAVRVMRFFSRLLRYRNPGGRNPGDRNHVIVGLLSGLVFFLLTAASALPEESAPPEHEVKAEMLYKFLGYVDWPASAFETAKDPYRIAILGSHQLEEELRRVAEERSGNGRPVEVIRVKKPAQVDNPHLVFVGRQADKHLPALGRMAEKRCFLLVTEHDDGLAHGGTINLRVVEGRVAFDVSLAGTKKCDYKLSARLLSVASSVKQEEG